MSLLVDTQATFATPTVSSFALQPVTSLRAGQQDQQVDSNTLVLLLASDVGSSKTGSTTLQTSLETASESILSTSSSTSSGASASSSNMAASGHHFQSGNTKLFYILSSFIVASSAIGAL